MTDLTDAEWRDCYYVYRALHDGVCPSCGYHGNTHEFSNWPEGVRCPNCDYHLTQDEIDTILPMSSRLLKRRLDAVEKMRGKNFTAPS